MALPQAPPSARDQPERDERPTRPEPRPANGPAPRTGAPPVVERPAPRRHDRDEDADLLLDVAELTVDQLNLELQASAGIDHIKLEATGLNTALFLKASLDNLVALRGRTPAHAGTTPRPRSAAALGSASAGEQDDEQDGDQNGVPALLDAVRRRAASAVKDGGKAASVAVAGAAGGALLERSLGHGRRRPKLSIPLPGRRRDHGLPALASTAERASKALLDKAQERLS